MTDDTTTAPPNPIDALVDATGVASDTDAWTNVHAWITKAVQYRYELYGYPGEGVTHGAAFLEHASDARENGNYLVCAACGYGMDAVDEDEDLHDDGCANRGKDPFGEMIGMLTERLGPEKVAEMVANVLSMESEPEPEKDE